MRMYTILYECTSFKPFLYIFLLTYFLYIPTYTEHYYEQNKTTLQIETILI